MPTLLVTGLLAGCGGSDDEAAPRPSPSSVPKELYVSLGDSYAAGYQPTSATAGATTTNGFAYQLVDGAKEKGYDLELVNFGCAGATTTSVLTQAGCAKEALGPDADQYAPKTQAAAAEEFVRANADKIALITVSIGGNDVTACAKAADAVSCVLAAVPKIKANLAKLLTGLRAAAGPDARIIGITYPDVLLGNYLSKDPALKSLATTSVTAFKSLINPALQEAYQAAGGQLVDVTAATGAYKPLETTTDLPPYGTIPVAVAQVCQLTYYCEYKDIHPRDEGYKIISDQVLVYLPRR